MVRISLIELPARWRAVDAQGELVRRLAEGHRSDVVLLPEAALTGYVSPLGDFDLRPQAEPEDVGLERLAALARDVGADIVGPLIIREDARAYNAVAGVAPDGEVFLRYRKRHPWIPETWATPGDGPHPLIQRWGLSVTCAVCFDVHFLAEEASAVLEAADVLLFPSAWVEEEDHRAEHFAGLADGFGVTVVNANWGPGSPRIPGQGRSMVVRPGGRRRELRDSPGRLDVVIRGR